MTPEPLTKEKIIEKLAKEYEEILESLNAISKDKVKQRVNWLLKEIEKEQEKYEPKVGVSYDRKLIYWNEGVSDGLEIAKDLIKKAFSGVVEE